MPRFFKTDFDTNPVLTGEDAAHIIKSLRMHNGEELTVCDTEGYDYKCVISDTSGGEVKLTIEEKLPNRTEPSVFVTLYQCLTKGDKFDLIVRQAVECGASRIVPVASCNCVSRPDERSLEKKVGRWQKIASEAAGQSGRGILPTVCGCIPFAEAVKSAAKDDAAFFCYERGTQKMGDISGDIKTVSLIIGPEGGFTEEEADAMRNAGVKVTSLGPRILRAETAPVAAITAIMLKTGNM